MAAHFQLAASILKNREILDLLCILSNDKEIFVTINESMKGAALTGITAFVGGLFFGPPGLAIGGAVGGLAASGMAKNFKPVSQIICEMSEEKKELLCSKVKHVLVNAAIQFGPNLLRNVQSHPSVHKELINIMRTFVTSELGMNLKA